MYELKQAIEAVIFPVEMGVREIWEVLASITPHERDVLAAKLQNLAMVYNAIKDKL